MRDGRARFADDRSYDQKGTEMGESIAQKHISCFQFWRSYRKRSRHKCLALLLIASLVGSGFAQDYGTEEMGMTMEELVEVVETAESLIADCMREAGFEYVAVDFTTARNAMLADKALPELAEREFKAACGFGITTHYADDPVPQFADDTTPAKIALGEQNVRIFQNLSEADQVAYNRTLLGENTDATFAVALEAEDFSRTGGCTEKAAEAVFDPEEITLSYRNPLDDLYAQDPRMIQAMADCTACVQEAGYEYTDPEAIEPDIERRFLAITGGAPTGSLSANARIALEALQAEERAIAVASFDCEDKYIHPVEEALDNE